ncbi:hypothetical protein D7X55_03660 [Corallococcus sp. AB049A]|uniref:hypothetical protein n=1 Tax=Corallococcus sp. AB049A TaxID=2316721 RepID=UPI000ED237BC|nr:hypothetical protein [Corallococcus sp. AB049A]RKI74015.1 hypothetical protein D7X55_03660 [Corallococcus sp. AB049A]
MAAAPAKVIAPTSKALVVEAPMLGVLDAMEAIPSPLRFQGLGRVLWILGPLVGVGLGLYYGTILEGAGSTVAKGVFLVSAILLWLRYELRSFRFHADGHPGDDPRRRSELVVRVLRRLREDLVPGAPIRLRIRPHPRDKGPGSSTFPLTFKKTAPPDQLDPWLQLETRLRDGAHLRLTAVERRRVKVSKAGPNGPRRRIKIREYDTLFLEARLRVKAKRHPQLATLSEDRAREAVRLPPGAKLHRLRIRGGHLRLRIQLDESWRPVIPKDAPAAPDASRAVTMMLLSLYQMLHLARTPEAPRAHPKPSHRREKSRRRRRVQSR